MNAKSNHPAVVLEINFSKDIVPFGIKHEGLFIVIPGVTINASGNLFYQKTNNEKKSVSSLIKHIKEEERL